MITMKGGYKTSANFYNMLNAGIINAGDTLFFKIKNIDNEKIKIPLKQRAICIHFLLSFINYLDYFFGIILFQF